MLLRLRLVELVRMRPARMAPGWWLALVALSLWLLSTVAGKAASFTATVDRDTLTMGESFTLSLNFEGAEPSADPVIPPIQGLAVAGPSRSDETTFSFVNGSGQSSHHTTFSYSLTPARPGSYVIPAIAGVMEGQTYASQAIRLKVLDAGKAQTTAGGAFLRMLVPKKEAYIGEILPVDIQLYFRAIQGAEMPQFKEEGFTAGKMLQAQQSSTVLNGQQYNVATMKTFVVPAKVGNLELGPATMSVNVPKPNSRRNIFGQLVDWESVNLESDPHPLKVLSLPTENVPASFTGAVGIYTVTISASPTNIAVGDPITVKIQVAGHGALEGVTLPQQTGWEQFKVYPPTSDFQPDANDPLGISGTRNFALTVVPQTMEAKELPVYAFSYFDPDKKSYQTATLPAISLIIRPSAASLPAPTASNPSAVLETAPMQDVSLIKLHLGTVAAMEPPLIERGWFMGLQGVPVIAWLAFLVRRKQMERLANNPRLRREREVETRVRRGLQELRQEANANQAEAFFATVVRLLQERLGERLDLPASAITEAILDERLRPLKVPEAQLATLTELFQLCNQARYGRQTTNEELVSLIPKVEAALEELRKIKA